MKRIAALALVLALALAFAGCNSAGKSVSDEYNTSYVRPQYGTAMAAGEYSMEEPAAPVPSPEYESSAEETALDPTASSDPAALAEMYGGRKIIRTYELTIISDGFDDDLAAMYDKLAALGGYAQSAYIDGKKPEVYGDSGRTARLCLRVPTDTASEFISGVKALGTVTNSYDYADDITDSYFDTETRLDVLKIQLERLKGILVETDNLADVVLLEQEIASVMYEIEELTGTLRKYDALIYYTTVNIVLSERDLVSGPAAERTPGERIADGFTDSLYSVGTFFVNLFVGTVSALPVILTLAVFALIVFLIVRAFVRGSRRKKAALAMKVEQTRRAIAEEDIARAKEAAEKAGSMPRAEGEDPGEKDDNKA